MVNSAEMGESGSLSALLLRATDWVSSADGRRVLADAARESERLTRELDKERRIDPKTLLEPVTL